MRYKNKFFAKKLLFAILSIVIFAVTYNYVFAYEINATNQVSGTSSANQIQQTKIPPINLDWIGNSINSISRWWQTSSYGITSFITNSFSSMRQVNTQVSHITVGNTNIGGIYQNLDSWLFGVVGFHITGIFTALISLFGWLLNLAKEIILWAISLIH
jgi:hypothetical protein